MKIFEVLTTTDDKTKLSNVNILSVGQKEQVVAELKHAMAPDSVTRRKMANISVDVDPSVMQDLLQGLEDVDTSNEPEMDELISMATQIPQLRRVVQKALKQANQVALRSTALDKKGTEVATKSVTINWTTIPNLPGYMSKALRVVARQIFGSFTKTNIEKIKLIIDLQGQGPNTEDEFKAIAHYVQQNGRRINEAELLFNKIIPAHFNAKLHVYEVTDGNTYFVAKDIGGKYVYTWPSKDNITPRSSISHT